MLLKILDEWSTKAKVDVRISNLRNGTGLNGPVVLKSGIGATVFDDGAVDQIDSGGGKDWIFLRLSGANADLLKGGIADNTIDLI